MEIWALSQCHAQVGRHGYSERRENRAAKLNREIDSIGKGAIPRSKAEEESKGQREREGAWRHDRYDTHHTTRLFTHTHDKRTRYDANLNRHLQPDIVEYVVVRSERHTEYTMLRTSYLIGNTNGV